ncbi:alpha/beta fold hydrolase [Nocardia sp. BMG51109]|uniref:alpha/beta fold hydrolase n=1 Tax=Nocardia sp. BMG51109 TaxID=1056816 RepID=UPI0004B17827|nr:alpha/beta fold hydrolase [Nocardia sp. BMG51109]
MRHLFTVFITALAVAMSGAGITACSGAQGRASDFDWRPCPENAEVECATLAVPVDWSDPGGQTIEMAVARKRTREADRLGTLVSLPGGPGTSGVDEVLHGDRLSPELHRRFDIVSLDPRGVGRSHPVRCDAGLATVQPNLVPDTGGRLAEVVSYARDLADSCREHTGPLVDHLDSASVARDVDALRKALGETTISIYGRSHGTASGQAYLELFPRQVRAMVLDGAVDHNLSGPDYLASEARAARDTFAEFVSWCDRESTCALHGRDIPALYDSLYDRAAHGLLSSPTGKRQDPLVLSQVSTQPLYKPDWPRLAEDLRARAERPLTPMAAPAPRRNGQPQPWPLTIMCADQQLGIRDQAHWEQLWAMHKESAGPLRSHFAWVATSLCTALPPAPNPPHPPRITDAPTTLLMNARFDPTTPHEWATHVAADTPHSVLLTYDGWGHGVYGRTACTTGAADRYFIDLVVPQPDTHCPAVSP